MAFYIMFLFGPFYLIYVNAFAAPAAAAAAAECVTTRKAFGAISCSAGCVLKAGKCVAQ